MLLIPTWILFMIKKCEQGFIYSNDGWMDACSMHACTEAWMDDLRFYVLFNSISVISGRLEVDNDRLCATNLYTVG